MRFSRVPFLVVLSLPLVFSTGCSSDRMAQGLSKKDLWSLGGATAGVIGGAVACQGKGGPTQIACAGLAGLGGFFAGRWIGSQVR